MEHFASDAQLLSQSFADPSLFAGLYERHASAVRRYVVRRVGAAAAEDLTADVFVRTFRARQRYRAEGPSALPWLLASLPRDRQSSPNRAAPSSGSGAIRRLGATARRARGRRARWWALSWSSKHLFEKHLSMTAFTHVETLRHIG
jgi:DNA-directed RNA polymerase specialized sigma24 family protein